MLCHISRFKDHWHCIAPFERRFLRFFLLQLLSSEEVMKKNIVTMLRVKVAARAAAAALSSQHVAFVYATMKAIISAGRLVSPLLPLSMTETSPTI